MQSLITDKYFIRPLENIPEDEEMFCRLYTDDKTMEYIGKTLSIEVAIKTFKVAVKKNAGSKKVLNTWAIVDKNSKKTIGIQFFFEREQQQENTIEIGIILLPEARGKRVPEESLVELIKYGFIHNNYDKIFICYDKRNKGTARFVATIGFYIHQAPFTGLENDITAELINTSPLNNRISMNNHRHD